MIKYNLEDLGALITVLYLPQESIPQPQQNEDELVIDWGGLGNANEDEGGIDFGEGEIDYDITLDLSGITVEDGGDTITTCKKIHIMQGYCTLS